MKTENILFIIGAVAFSMALMTVVSKTTAQSKVYLGNVTLDTTQENFIYVAQDVAVNRTYDSKKYNCWDFSTDLVKELRKNGYASRVVFGTVNCSCDDWFDSESCTGVHAWVEVMIPIEATGGLMVPADVYKRCYTFGYYATEKHA